MLIRHAARTALKAPSARIAAGLLAGTMLAGALAGCSHAGSTTAGGAGAGAVVGATTSRSSAPSSARTKGAVGEGTAAFCSFIMSVNSVAAKATSQQRGLQLLSTIVPRMQAQTAAAPPSVAADFGIVAAAAKQAAAEADLAPLATNQVATAGTALTAYCHARS